MTIFDADDDVHYYCEIGAVHLGTLL